MYRITRLSDGEVHEATGTVEMADLLCVKLTDGTTPLVGYYKVDREFVRMISECQK